MTNLNFPQWGMNKVFFYSILNWLFGWTPCLQLETPLPPTHRPSIIVQGELQLYPHMPIVMFHNSCWWRFTVITVMVIIRTWIRATRLLIGSWRRFTSHPKGFFSSKLDGGEYQLISRESCYSHVSLNPLTNMHVVWVIITSELSTCLKGLDVVTGSKVWMAVKLPGEVKRLQGPRRISPVSLIQALMISEFLLGNCLGNLPKKSGGKVFDIDFIHSIIPCIPKCCTSETCLKNFRIAVHMCK